VIIDPILHPGLNPGRHHVATELLLRVAAIVLVGAGILGLLPLIAELAA
jgi:hypothetical protein